MFDEIEKDQLIIQKQTVDAWHNGNRKATPNYSQF